MRHLVFLDVLLEAYSKGIDLDKDPQKAVVLC